MRKKKVIDYFFGPNFVYKSDTFFIKKSQLTNVLRHLLIRHLSGSNLSLTWLAFYTTLRKEEWEKRWEEDGVCGDSYVFKSLLKVKNKLGQWIGNPKQKHIQVSSICSNCCFQCGWLIITHLSVFFVK